MKKTRAWLAVFFAFIALFGDMSIRASATNGESDVITVYVNNAELVCDTAPFIEKGRTMVPMRRIFEALGAQVTWNGADKSITAAKGETEIRLCVGDATLYRNGESVFMDVVPQIVNNSTFVPLRAVSQSLEATVTWFAQTRSVYIDSEELYARDYAEAAELYFAAIVPAGYQKVETTDLAELCESICLYGKNTAVQVVNDTVYMVFETEASPTKSAAVRIGESEATDASILRDILAGKTVSVAGTYVGLSNDLQIPTLYWAQIAVFESDTDYTSDELLCPAIYRINDTVTLYDESNHTCVVRATRVEEYLEDGWSESPMVLLYALDGEQIYVPEELVALHTEFGWYTEPTILMYAADGRELAVPTAETEAYRAVGWYDFPVMTVYAADGRSELIACDDFDAYYAVGWYGSYEEAYAATHPYVGSYEDTSVDSNTQSARGLYRTPYGECYHFDPQCGGKNSYAISWSQVGSLRPCSKCAR